MKWNPKLRKETSKPIYPKRKKKSQIHATETVGLPQRNIYNKEIDTDKRVENEMIVVQGRN